MEGKDTPGSDMVHTREGPLPFRAPVGLYLESELSLPASKYCRCETGHATYDVCAEEFPLFP